jgi:hypothetical protein
MRLPWFFATTPAPRPAVPLPRRPAARPSWAARLARAYLAWAERSHEALRRQPGPR